MPKNVHCLGHQFSGPRMNVKKGSEPLTTLTSTLMSAMMEYGKIMAIVQVGKRLVLLHWYPPPVIYAESFLEPCFTISLRLSRHTFFKLGNERIIFKTSYVGPTVDCVSQNGNIFYVLGFEAFFPRMYKAKGIS